MTIVDTFWAPQLFGRREENWFAHEHRYILASENVTEDIKKMKLKQFAKKHLLQSE